MVAEETISEGRVFQGINDLGRKDLEQRLVQEIRSDGHHNTEDGWSLEWLFGDEEGNEVDVRGKDQVIVS